MLPDLLAALMLAFPIVEPAADVAGPCPGYYEDDPCEEVEHWLALQPHNAAEIPSDGVLVLRGEHRGPWDENVAPKVDVVVEHEFVPVPGTLELAPMEGVLVWRPDAPWIPGATYKFSATAMYVDEAGLSCTLPMLGTGGELVVAGEPGAPLGPPMLAAAARVDFFQDISLTGLACCEGVAPMQFTNTCGDVQLSWDPTMCAPVSGTGSLRVDFTGEPAAKGPAAQQIVYTRKVDGAADLHQLEPTFSLIGLQPYCVEFAALDLASGKITTSGERCFGDDVADLLGPQTIEPPDALTCPLQQCEVTESSWDLERCMPYGPQPGEAEAETAGEDTGEDTGEADAAGEGGEAGCGCVVSSAGDTGLLALVGLLGLARRRRVSGRRA
jgi:MYXO-CTERM domain-containing protein